MRKCRSSRSSSLGASECRCSRACLSSPFLTPVTKCCSLLNFNTRIRHAAFTHHSIRLHKHRVGPSPGRHLERSPVRITPSGRYVPGGRMTPSGRFTPTVGRQRSFFAGGMGLGVEGSQHGVATAPQLDPVYVLLFLNN